MNTNKLFPIIGALLLIVIVYFAYGLITGPRLFKDYELRTVKVGKTNYRLYVADTADKRMQGLSNIVKLPKNQGMLFVFETPDTYGFWMKDMNIALDIIYIREGKIVDLKENILASSFPQIFYPLTAVDAVIELNVGEIMKSGVSIGDPVKALK